MKIKKIHFATLSLIVLTACGSCKKEEPVCLYGPAPSDKPEPIRLLYGVQPRDEELRNAPTQPEFNPDSLAGDWAHLQSLIPEDDAEEA